MWTAPGSLTGEAGTPTDLTNHPVRGSPVWQHHSVVLTDAGAVTADSVVTADICIVGAGPAGITLAHEFIGTSARVVLLESGSFGYDETAQDLGRGQVSSEYFYSDSLASGRRRQFGGTPNRWSYTTEPSDNRLYARCLPPQELDFEPAPDDPETVWPLTFDDLRPFYARAQKVWNGGTFDYDIDTWACGLPALDIPGGDLATKMCQHGPSDVFTLGYRDDIIAAENIDLHLDCTAVSFEAASATDRVETLRVVTGSHRVFSITAQTFVLACGGVENVQVLLSSDLTRPEAPGNSFDNVGRYVTDHPSFRLGTIVPTTTDVYGDLALYDIRWVGPHMVSAFLTISDAVKRAERLLNMSVALAPRGRGFGTASHHAISRISDLKRFGTPPSQIAADVASVLRSPVESAATILHRNDGHYAETRGGWSKPDVDRSQFGALELWAETAQTPQRDCRLTLGDDRDPIGRRRLHFEHRWSASDRQNLQRSTEFVVSQLVGIGLGQFQSWTEFDGPNRPRFDGLHHPMGGTRMHVDPRFGVVDENCRVHGLTNIYVAGSSVFPNSIGYANPTLTLLALAVRLADHMKESLG